MLASLTLSVALLFLQPDSTGTETDTIFIVPDSFTTINKSNMLLLDMDMQVEITSAVNNLYNFKFDAAEKEFNWMKYRYPEHPLPYFLLGLAQWWRIVPDIDTKAYDDQFLTYMDLSIEKAEKLFKENEQNIEARFFLAAAYAFKGRLYSERGSYAKATVAGKNTLTYFELGNEKNALSPEFLFGDGLYNYYSEWIRDNYGWLKPVLAFFPEGDKDLGVKQLQYVSNNAFYTRTEAQNFLMRILSDERETLPDALRIARYLNFRYPDNSYFHRSLARYLYQAQNYKEMETVCLDILAKIDSNYYGYEANSGRYASFFLGQYYELIRNFEDALTYYNRSIDFGEETEAYQAGYFLYSWLRAGKIYERMGNESAAKKYYKQAKKYAKRSHQAFDTAKGYLREL